jgi:methane/ammonia monooxygenase subunit B
MKTIKDRIARWSFVGLLMSLAVATFYTPTASAHGEKSQAAFMRMRTIHWFDLNWSKESVAVNENVEISGKFHVFDGWPETVDHPDVSFLNIGIPGPTFIRAESYIGDKLVPRSVALELGETYSFRVVLKARRPGEWHVHTMMNVEGGGPIIGPGKWIAVTGTMGSFVNPLTTLTGVSLDLETFSAGTIWSWHILWYVLGLAWMLYFCRGPVFLPRFMMVRAGRASELITATDRKVAIAFTAGTLLLVGFGYSNANSTYPVTIPLQAGTMRGMIPLEGVMGDVHVKVDDATYRVPGRAMAMTLTIHNGSDSAVRIGEFMAGAVRFMDPDVFVDETGYPEDLLAPEGLTVSDNSPIQPDETRTITVTATDAAWEIYRLSDIIYDPDSRFAGQLYFFDDAGNRSITVIEGPLIPTFM